MIYSRRGEETGEKGPAASSTCQFHDNVASDELRLMSSTVTRLPTCSCKSLLVFRYSYTYYLYLGLKFTVRRLLTEFNVENTLSESRYCLNALCVVKQDKLSHHELWVELFTVANILMYKVNY